MYAFFVCVIHSAMLVTFGTLNSHQSIRIILCLNTDLDVTLVLNFEGSASSDYTALEPAVARLQH